MIENDLLTRVEDILHSAMAQQIDEEISLTTDEAAKFLKVHKQELLRYVKLGLPHYEMGKGFRFLRRDLIAYREKFRKGQMIDHEEIIKHSAGVKYIRFGKQCM